MQIPGRHLPENQFQARAQESAFLKRAIGDPWVIELSNTFEEAGYIFY